MPPARGYAATHSTLKGMSRREFTFVEGSSSKFWAIEQSGKSFTVTFGRIGTAGQTQTKEFGSEDEAKKAAEKLIAEKTKKGYTESGAQPAAPAASSTSAKPKKGAKAAAPEPEPEAPAPEPAPGEAVSLEVVRRIDLDPADFAVVTWKPRESLAPPEPPPYDFAKLQARLKKIQKNTYGWVNWDRADFAPNMSRKEAHFWFLALTGDLDKKTPAEIADQIKEKDVTGALTLDDMKKRLKKATRYQGHYATNVVMNLFEPAQLIEMFAQLGTEQNGVSATEAIEHFTRYTFPYLTASELKAMRALAKNWIDPKNWPKDFYDQAPIAFFFAALLGMSKELLPVIRAIPDGHYAQSGWDHSHYHQTQRVVFGLGSADVIASETRRLKLPLKEPQFVRSWLALTEFSALEYLRDSILTETNKDANDRLVREFCRANGPEAAPHVLELKLNAKAPGAAREWLATNVGNAIHGLVPVAAGRGKLAEAAVEYLREQKRLGREAVIRAAVKAAPADVAEAVRKSVLDHTEKVYADLDAKKFPKELTAGFADATSKKAGKLPTWADPAALPPILVGDAKLSAAHTKTVLEALQRAGAPDQRAPLIAALKQHGDPVALDAFAWKLFQQWQGDGYPSKEKWALGAIGQLGGDACALKLTPLVRNWPGESQHQRAVFGLDCLRGIGSDTALMQLNGIAQKLKFKGLKDRAAKAMEAIAKEKNLTREQLEDRIVPDCDLDEPGTRVFDFGTRQFRFVLGPDMKAMVKDPEGKVKTDLPKPGTKDDAAKADEAVGAWKLMKKQVKEVATIQARRLEQAMVTGRRWPLADFDALLVKHPLMINLVRRLLWGAYDAKGKLVAAFRVTEDQALADAKDGTFKPTGVATVGVLHPLLLTDFQKAEWGGVFGDYEIVPPFPQLGRAINHLDPKEAKATELGRFKGVKLYAPTMVFGLEHLGWVRDGGGDGGGFSGHSKHFPFAGVTANVTYDGMVAYGFINPDELLTFETCYFTADEGERKTWRYRENRMKLSDVDPVVTSEVIKDLSELAAKAKN